MSAGFSVLFPLFTYSTFIAIPTELNSLLLYHTSYEGTANRHSGLALTSTTSAFTPAMIYGAKPAREIVDFNLSPSNIHDSSSRRIVSSVTNHWASERKVVWSFMDHEKACRTQVERSRQVSHCCDILESRNFLDNTASC